MVKNIFERGNSMASKFGKNLLKVLEEKHVTQQQLADAIGISNVSVNRYISGERNPSAETVAKMAQALGVSTDTLLESEKSSSILPVITVGAIIAGIAYLIGKNLLSSDDKTKIVNTLFQNGENNGNNSEGGN